MAIDVSKFVARFVEETRDHIERLNEGLSSLDGGHADSELINTIFRSAHTIKGSSRMLKLSGITDTAHHIEEVLMHLRDGSLTYSPTLGQLLYRGVDALSALVKSKPSSVSYRHSRKNRKTEEKQDADKRKKLKHYFCSLLHFLLH